MRPSRGTLAFMLVAVLACAGALRLGAEGPATKAPASAPASMASSAPASKPSRYEQARELYREGIMKAPQIIALLREEIAENPSNRDAVALLGITLYGTGKFEEAIEQFQKAEDMARKSGELVGRISFLRAKALVQLRRYEDAAQTLNAHWAVFDTDSETQKEYRSLNAQVTEIVLGRRALASVNIVADLTKEDMAGWAAIPVESSQWDRVSKMADIGPFLGLRKPGRGTMAMIIIPDANSRQYCGCVFWEDRKPIKSVVLAASSAKGVDLAELQRKYIDVDPNYVPLDEMVAGRKTAATSRPAAAKETKAVIFESVTIEASDGESLPAVHLRAIPASMPASKPAERRK
jgi:hypothetical protein